MTTENQAPEGAPSSALEALMQIKATLVLENEKGAQSAIVDTIWHGPGETLFDFIDNSIAALAAQPQQAPQPDSFHASSFIQHVQSVADGGHSWADEFIKWYSTGEWLSEERAAAVFLGGKLAPQQSPAEVDATDLADFLANTLGFVGDVDDAAAEIVAFLASRGQPKGTAELPEPVARASKGPAAFFVKFSDWAKGAKLVGHIDLFTADQMRAAIAAAQAPAPAPGEPVAYRVKAKNGNTYFTHATTAIADAEYLAKLRDNGDAVTLLYAAPQTQAPAVKAGWLPMESAPQDGTKVLLDWGESADVCIGWFEERTCRTHLTPWRRDRFASWETTSGVKPIGWLPLPVGATKAQPPVQGSQS